MLRHATPLQNPFVQNQASRLSALSTATKDYAIALMPAYGAVVLADYWAMVNNIQLHF
jgi:hypothetical protein